MHLLARFLRAALCCALISAAPTGALAQAAQVPLAESCFQANVGVTGQVGALGAINGGSGGTSGVYAGVALAGGVGTGALANITVSGGSVTAVAITNPGLNYAVGDTLSATSASIGGVTGFFVPVNSTSVLSGVSGGTVGFYTPGTLVFAQTWQNAGETILNSNPVALDANGCAIIYGSGTYRQILKDSLGNTVWDQLTTAPPGPVADDTLVSSTVTSSSGVSLTDETPQDITSINLTPGTWLVSGNVGTNATVGVFRVKGWISLVSATLPVSNPAALYDSGTPSADTSVTGVLPTVNATGSIVLQLSATTTVYLSTWTHFTSGADVGFGFVQAVRLGNY